MPDVAGNVPAAGMGFKGLQEAATGRPDVGAAPGAREPHAMNMRAAEAMVSNAPKAMKILPTSEV